MGSVGLWKGPGMGILGNYSRADQLREVLFQTNKRSTFSKIDYVIQKPIIPVS